MNEKQAMELVDKIVRLVAPAIHRMNFEDDFESWLNREGYILYDECKEEFFDAVYQKFSNFENLDMATYEVFANIVKMIFEDDNNNWYNEHCDCCNALLVYNKDSLVITHNGRTYCQRCYNDCFVKCDHCGKELHCEESISAIRNRLTKHYCKDCAGVLLSAEGD